MSDHPYRTPADVPRPRYRIVRASSFYTVADLGNSLERDERVVAVFPVMMGKDNDGDSYIEHDVLIETYLPAPRVPRPPPKPPRSLPPPIVTRGG